ncbi:NAD-dependent epimerase [Aquabacterium sp.]|uniref:NAD-dependent epimerase n=1 Tax=Aquabacterium sp. TaxID=1872578 RepID=UPI002C22E131|nr:NAD-dependent epimerase [Aquabacterium sp.]HSW06826.1 NAD-dependent epimerase [Aquabacterium sp.]
MKILLTGAAGFIGSHVAKLLLDRGDEVIGLDNLNDYYDPQLKKDRLAQLSSRPLFRFVHLDLASREDMAALFQQERFDRVVHLAAQAGVRHSLIDPHAYIDSNIVGFMNILEGCRHSAVEHLVYASSSSVYGNSTVLPFAEQQRVDHPISLYAATKKSNELMAHTYSHLFRLPTTGLRFFTVYGPWGRPDMALFLFTKAILAGEPIKVFNRGNMLRDFTYIDDIATGVILTLDRAPTSQPDHVAAEGDPSLSDAPYRLFNIGNTQPVKLMDFIEAIERSAGRSAVKEYHDMQPGDVPATCADVSALERWVNFRPDTSIDVGVARFVAWYRQYYGV